MLALDEKLVNLGKTGQANFGSSAA